MNNAAIYTGYVRSNRIFFVRSLNILLGSNVTICNVSASSETSSVSPNDIQFGGLMSPVSHPLYILQIL